MNINHELLAAAAREPEPLNATETASLFAFSADMLALWETSVLRFDSDRLAATTLLNMWKASFDEPQATA